MVGLGILKRYSAALYSAPKSKVLNSYFLLLKLA
jgi:hypothetical protein